MAHSPQNPKEADFSKFMEKSKPAQPSGHPAITEHVPKRKISKRMLILIVVMVALAIIQAVILYLGRPPKAQFNTSYLSELNHLI